MVEASSYQLEYSKIFTSKYAAILNISPDHIERHKSLKRYVQAKLSLLNNQSKKSFGFVKKDDLLINKYLRIRNLNCKIIKVNTKLNKNIFNKIDNKYFLSEANKENLLFAYKILSKFRLKKNLLLRSIKKFRGLKYRQQIIFKNSQMMIINDSKSTSFSSSLGVLKTNKNTYWLLGGINKVGDKFNLPKKYYPNIKAFIFGKNKNFL